MGKKIVWTVHNLSAHEPAFPKLERKLNIILYKNVDGFISLNEAGLTQIRNKALNIKKQHFIHIPHPHYKNHYPNEISKEDARNKLGIERNKFVFLFLGQIRPYKNVIGLIEAFNKLNDEDSLLLIAGSVLEELKETIKYLTSNNKRIKLYDAFIKDEDIQIYLNSADLVVSPYLKIFNSGVLYLNLSFNKPTLAPDLPFFNEMQKKLGPYWVRTYKGLISSDILKFNMTDKCQIDKENLEEILDSYSPEIISYKMISFYKSLNPPNYK